MRANNTPLTNDGVSMMRFAVYDQFSLPVVGQMVEFELDGAGSLPTTK